MNVVGLCSWDPSNLTGPQKHKKYGPGKYFKFERKINDHEIARDSAETIAPRRWFFFFLQLEKRINYSWRKLRFILKYLLNISGAPLLNRLFLTLIPCSSSSNIYGGYPGCQRVFFLLFAQFSPLTTGKKPSGPQGRRRGEKGRIRPTARGPGRACSQATSISKPCIIF